MDDSYSPIFNNRIQEFILFASLWAVSFFAAVKFELVPLLLLCSAVIVLFLIFKIPELGFAFFLLIGVLKNITTHLPFDLTIVLFLVTSISLIMKFIQNKMQCDISNKYFLSLLTFTLLVIIGYFFTKSPHAGLLKTSRFVLFNMFLLIGGLSIGFTKNSSEKFIKIIFIILLLYSLVYVYFFKDVIGMNMRELAEYHLRFTLVGNPIGVGRIFSVLVIISLVFLINQKKNSLIYIAGLLLGLVVALATNSRGPLVALLLTLFTYLFFFSRIKKIKLINITLFLILIFIGLLTILPKNFVNRYTFGLSKELHVSETEVKFFSTSQEREIYLTQALEYLSDNPEKLILGSGTGSFSYISKHIDDRLYPHNIFVEILLEFGVMGVIAFLLPFMFLFIDFLRYKTLFSKGDYVNLSIWISLTILFFINAQVSGDINDNRLLWFFEGGFVGLILRMIRDHKIQRLNEA